MRNTNRLRKPNMLVLAVCLILSLIAIMIIPPVRARPSSSR